MSPKLTIELATIRMPDLRTRQRCRWPPRAATPTRSDRLTESVRQGDRGHRARVERQRSRVSLRAWEDEVVEPEELAEALTRLARWAERHTPVPESAVRRRLREHFGIDPMELPVVTRPLQPWDRPNLQVALDVWLEDREVEVVGVAMMEGYRAGLAELVRGGQWAAEVQLGAPAHVAVALGEGESVTCVESGLWLVDGQQPIVLMLNSVDLGAGERLALEVMGPQREQAEEVLRVLRRLMAEHNVYRGRVLELRARHFHDDEGAPLTVRTLPTVTRERIVLPDGVLERIERQAFGIAKHAQRLRASGRHLRRGLLLHGPPGTGKTLTVMYLAAQMPERTVVMLDRAQPGTGWGIGRLGDGARAGDGRARGRRPRGYGALV